MNQSGGSIPTFFKRRYKKNMNYSKYEYALSMLETEVNVLIKEFSRIHGYMPVEHQKSRLKSEKSIIEKLNRKGKEYTEENVLRYISDVVGLRLVVSFISDVYDIVSLLSRSVNLIIKEKKDYILEPKTTGYSSYHLKVLVPIYLDGYVEYIPAEIQVRTVAMDFWASLDHKIRYKFPDVIPEDVQEKMRDYAKDIQELDRKMYELNKVMNNYE